MRRWWYRKCLKRRTCLPHDPSRRASRKASRRSSRRSSRRTNRKFHSLNLKSAARRCSSRKWSPADRATVCLPGILSKLTFLAPSMYDPPQPRRHVARSVWNARPPQMTFEEKCYFFRLLIVTLALACLLVYGQCVSWIFEKFNKISDVRSHHDAGVSRLPAAAEADQLVLLLLIIN